MDHGPIENEIGDLDRIVRRYHDEVMRQALSMLHDFHRAQDVTQETFFRSDFVD